uniref:Uncharacterized protein n=1 Tax=Candidatus Methanogaster sp. ANME-2c ERB4 TaxID=2759911 RepID=A0A7G9YDM4_9EURY|nr:hypothetical protein MFHEKKGA_00001 [Methanosarcinales archaeon ANME-2c ERB4]
MFPEFINRRNPHLFEHLFRLLPDSRDLCNRHRVKELLYTIGRNNGQPVRLLHIRRNLCNKLVRTDPDGTRELLLFEDLLFGASSNPDRILKSIRFHIKKSLVDTDSLEFVHIRRTPKNPHDPSGNALVQSHCNRQKRCIGAEPVRL